MGGETETLKLEKDSSGAFVTSLDVGWIKSDSGDIFGCQPSLGASSEVKVHVIREGYHSNIKVSVLVKCNYRFNADGSEWKCSP